MILHVQAIVRKVPAVSEATAVPSSFILREGISHNGRYPLQPGLEWDCRDFVGTAKKAFFIMWTP